MTHPAYLASASTIADPKWYVDSGASTHITSNPANYDHAIQSYGKQEIIVGNGEKLMVKHTGIATIPCET